MLRETMKGKGIYFRTYKITFKLFSNKGPEFPFCTEPPKPCSQPCLCRVRPIGLRSFPSSTLPPMLHSASLELLQDREHARLHPATWPLSCYFRWEHFPRSPWSLPHADFFPQMSPPDPNTKWLPPFCSPHENATSLLITHLLSQPYLFF